MLCKSLEYSLTPFRVTGANADVEVDEDVNGETAAVPISPEASFELLIGAAPAGFKLGLFPPPAP
jgi:hypothetical protein